MIVVEGGDSSGTSGSGVETPKLGLTLRRTGSASPSAGTEINGFEQIKNVEIILVNAPSRANSPQHRNYKYIRMFERYIRRF